MNAYLHMNSIGDEITTLSLEKIIPSPPLKKVQVPRSSLPPPPSPE